MSVNPFQVSGEDALRDLRLASKAKGQKATFPLTMKNQTLPQSKTRFPIIGMARLALLAVVVAGLSASAWAGFGFKLDGTLDKEAISHAYFEGDFSRVLLPLETYRQIFPATATREDSVFVYKYLSVIYAADSTTRPKAESYMVQLLRLMPTIELVDMYISDNIHAIFKDVRQKFLDQQKYVREHDRYGRPMQDTAAAGKPARRSHAMRWIGWTLGGVGTAAVAATAYYVMNEEPKTRTDRVVLPSGD